MLFKSKTNQGEFSVRPARLEDSKILSIIQQEYSKELHLFLGTSPATPETIRLSIGNGLLDLHAYNVIEQEGQVIGFLQQKQLNNKQILLGYPYVLLNHPQRKEIQVHLVKKTLVDLKAYGYKHALTSMSVHLSEGIEIFKKVGFSTSTPIYQEFKGNIVPDFDLDHEKITFRRVKTSDLETTYSWIKRQINPISPLAISKERYANLLYGPKSLREGWSIAVINDRPVAMISSLINEAADTVIIFGPFNEPTKEGVSARIPLLNELLLYHFMKNRSSYRLMRINTFDNDKELLKKFKVKLVERKDLYVKRL